MVYGKVYGLLFFHFGLDFPRGGSYAITSNPPYLHRYYCHRISDALSYLLRFHRGISGSTHIRFYGSSMRA